jgi:hypothetical protein
MLARRERSASFASELSEEAAKLTSRAYELLASDEACA